LKGFFEIFLNAEIKKTAEEILEIKLSLLTLKPGGSKFDALLN